MRPTYGPAEETLRPHTAAELMLTSSSSMQNGLAQGNARPAPAVPVLEPGARELELAAHRL